MGGSWPPRAGTWSSRWRWPASRPACVSAVAYAVVLLLPAQSWVLNAADSYAHFLTLPVGLWTLAALIELAQRSLPMASPARAAAHAADANGESGRQHPSLLDAHPPVAAPAS